MTISDAASSSSGRVGRYRLIDVIGSGGMGVVFKAQHETTGARVALKKVLASGDYDIGGMRREIDALRRLDHPGVVRIVDQGIDGGAPWYAMELLEGETLAAYNERRWRTYMPRGPCMQVTRRVKPMRSDALSESDEEHLEDDTSSVGEIERARAATGALPFALTVVRRLCITLGFVHGEGIVHRDLKSANVLLCDGDVPKLLDFGLAWRFPGAAGREVLDDVTVGTVGTVGYMAPEQIRGEMVDARADLYSLGCVLYELLTGRLPFSGHTSDELRKHHLATKPMPPSSLVEGVPQALDELVLRLLAKRPEERFGHANEVARQLALLGADGHPWEQRVRARSYVYRSGIVGREQSLELLESHVDHALGERGSLLLISGESGIGKTYLAMAAARDAASSGMTVITGTCVPLGVTGEQQNDAMLHPFRGFLLGIVDRCLAAPELTPLLLGPRAKLLAACEPSLAALPGLLDYPEPEALPAQATQQRLLTALAETIAAVSEVWPLVVLLDDLQWADELSLSFLASLPDDWFANKRLLLIGVYRADEETRALRALVERSYTRKIELGRLREQSVGALVRGMLAIDDPPSQFVDLLARQSAGNPFFVAEYLRTAVAEQLLFRSGKGSWMVDERLLEVDSGQAVLSLPNSLAELVARRLAGLSNAAQRLLAVAAVLGREVEWELLLSLAALRDEEAWEPARELLARQILEEVTSFGLPPGSDAGRGRLRFLHDKIRETAYSQIPEERRRTLHRQAALAIEQQCRAASELPLVYATLAHHHGRGEQIVEAIHYLELAGEHALETYANHDALSHFEAAITLDRRARGHDDHTRSTWDHALARPESQRLGVESTERAAALRRARWERKLSEAHYALGDLEAVDRHVRRALEQTGHTPPSSNLGWFMSLVRDLPQQVFRRADRQARRPRDRLDQETLAEAATAMHHLAERRYYSFDVLPMLGASLRSVNLAEQSGIDVRIAAPYAMLGMTAGISKMRTSGERYFELARKAAVTTGDDVGMVSLLYAEAAWRIGDGAWREVRALCDEGIAIAQRIHDVKSLGMVQTLAAHVDFYTGRFQESARTYRELEQTARRTGDRQHLSWGLYAGARARMCLGDFDEARRMLLESIAVLEPLVEVPSKIIAPGLLASLYLRMGDMERALEMADLTTARIRKNLPTIFATVAGYAGVAEVYLARWEQLAGAGKSREVRAARAVARRAVFDLMLLAFNIPIGWPYYHRCKGEASRLDRKPAAARRSFEQSLHTAQKLGMPYDEALAHLDLARLGVGSASSLAAHFARAEQILEELGCRYDLARTRRIRSGAVE